MSWLAISRRKFYEWNQRYGRVNEHNNWIPRDSWLADWEKVAIVSYYRTHSLDGYRRLTFMMLDEDIVAVSPTTTWRVLSNAGLINKRKIKKSSKGNGFKQPKMPHKNRHIDISYINVKGTFYYLFSILDGYSRFIIHWQIRESMTESEVEIILQEAREKFPGATPRIISDNGPQFIAKDFKEFIRIVGMTHVRCSPHYPQSNGKIERWHKSLKQESIRPNTPLSLEDARRIVDKYVTYYNDVRLHSANGYITPRDKLEGRAEAICASRDKKLMLAREQRKNNRQEARNQAQSMIS